MNPKLVYATNYTVNAGRDSLTSRHGEKAIDLILAVQDMVNVAHQTGQPIPEQVYVSYGGIHARFDFVREEERGIYYTYKHQ